MYKSIRLIIYLGRERPKFSIKGFFLLKLPGGEWDNDLELRANTSKVRGEKND